MKRLLIFAFAFFLSLSLFAQEESPTKATSQQSCSKDRVGHLSTAGVYFCCKDAASGSRRVNIPAPDRNAVLVLWERGMDLYNKDGKAIDAERSSICWAGAWGEAIWSPDSRYVLISRLKGNVFEVQLGSMDHKYPLQWDNKCEDTGMPEHLRCERVVDTLLRRDFLERHEAPCSSEQDISVWGLTWLEGSSKAVFIAQKTANYGHCERTVSGGQSDDFEAYVVSIPQREIIERVPRQVAIQRWEHLMASVPH